jgi:hypothetical protein
MLKWVAQLTLQRCLAISALWILTGSALLLGAKYLWIVPPFERGQVEGHNFYAMSLDPIPLTLLLLALPLALVALGALSRRAATNERAATERNSLDGTPTNSILDQVCLEAEVERRVKLRLNESSQLVLSRVSPAVRPLFVPKSDGSVVHIGSSVLLRIDREHFVVTASHVLDSAPPTVALYVGTPSAMPEIEGRRVKNVPGYGGRRLDQVDVGFVQLLPEDVERMAGCYFLAPDEIDVNDVAFYAPVVGTKYLSVGYPHELVSFSEDGSTYRARCVPWIGNPQSLSTSPEIGLSESSHVMLEFDGQRVAEQLQREAPINPRGMSGGGLFRFELSPKAASAGYKLVGILIQEHLEERGTLLATRLAFVTEGIRAMCPHLSGHIPQPNHIRISASEFKDRPPLGENREF